MAKDDDIMNKHQNMAQGGHPYAEFEEAKMSGSRSYEGGHEHPGHGKHYDEHTHKTDPSHEGNQHHGDHGHGHTPVHHEGHHGGHVHMHHHHPSDHDGGHGGHPIHGRKKNF